MIVFDLSCAEGHRFEGWFGSSDDFSSQLARGLVACPQCGSPEVAKAPMAPAVPAKGNQRNEVQAARRPVAGGKIPPEVRRAMEALAKAQARALEKSTWVGEGFAEESRAMHYGEKDLAAIHGKATLEEAKELLDEGIGVAPLPFPIAEPDELN
ncbi:DUF1178 family protein [Pelagerythrobacter sp.]|uniref:DUF1178 family protein n=1 Tax=Pelagerythrobacter sp. TaxID=2800702 RepID=UPI0035B00DBF